MSIDNLLLIGIMLGVLLAWAVCGWMIYDLWNDRRILNEKRNSLKVTQADKIYNSRDIRNNVIAILTAFVICVIFWPMFAILIGLSFYVHNLDTRVIITRVAILIVVYVLPIAAIWDRYTRITASRAIQEDREYDI